jgi:ATP-dependent DNA helicase RecG
LYQNIWSAIQHFRDLTRFDDLWFYLKLSEIESFRIERTVSVDKTDKFAQAICAFANDMAASGLPGYLLIGADDKTGTPSGLHVTDQLLQNLASLASNGNILPAPALIGTTARVS